MQKKNRIMMIAVSSLLCLTLISSCLVSGVFAKYVTKDTANVTTVFKKWGVTVTADVRDDLAEIATVTGEGDGSATVTISGLNMKPGDDFSDAVRFTITGTPEVKCQVDILMRIRYGTNVGSNTYDDMRIDDKLGLSGTWYFMPVGLTFGTGYYNSQAETYAPVVYSKDANKNVEYIYLTDPWLYCQGNGVGQTSSELAISVIRDKFQNGMAAKVLGATSAGTSYGGDYRGISLTRSPSDAFVFYTNDFSGTKTEINTFSFGFVFPYEYSRETDNSVLTSEKLDEIATYMSNYESETDGTHKYKFTAQYIINITQVK